VLGKLAKFFRGYFFGVPGRRQLMVIAMCISEGRGFVNANNTKLLISDYYCGNPHWNIIDDGIGTLHCVGRGVNALGVNGAVMVYFLRLNNVIKDQA